MVKVTRTMTIDSEIATQFQRLFPNEASSFCNEQMRLRIASTKGDLSAVDIELLKVKEAEAQAEYDQCNSILLTLKEQIRTIQEQNKADERVRLETEKARIESLHTCSGCGKRMSQPKVVFKDSKFCGECFDNQTPEVVKAMRME